MRTYQQLCTDIENALHRKIKTPKDFEFLRGRIYIHQHQIISMSTLMRFWGYIDEPVKPRDSTLDILARFLNYRSWEEYSLGIQPPAGEASSPIINRHLNVTRDLIYGDRIRLSWQPGRICDIAYQGEHSFVVIASENTRLRPGDTFECSFMIEEEPLYIDHLIQEDRPPISYVCGKISGIHFEILVPEA